MPAAPPPLPEGLSSRLRSTIDPLTGKCKHHPAVQLYELVENNTRWVVRRKICYKCGSRSQGDGTRHRPGVAVANPGREREGSASRPESSAAKGRSRSESVDRAGRANRGRSHSVSRPRLLDHGNGVLAASNQRLEMSGRGRTSARHHHHEHEGGGGRARSSGRRSSSRDVGGGGRRSSHNRSYTSNVLRDHGDDAASAPKTSSFHGRALEFSQKNLEESHPPPVTEVVPTRPPPPPPPAVATPVEDIPEEFDESDPVIIVPVVIDPKKNFMPPPPPRTIEEMERHQERIEMRRAHIRRDREERRKGRIARGIVKEKGKGKIENNRSHLKIILDSKERSGERARNGRVDRHRGNQEDPPHDNTRNRSDRRHGHSSPKRKNGGDVVPSPEALAMLEGRSPVEDPPQEKRDRRHRDKTHGAEDGDARHPSPTVMAILEGRTPTHEDPSQEKRERRHSRGTSTKKQGGDGGVCPSPAALALLEANDTSRALERSNRRQSRHISKKNQARKISDLHRRAKENSELLSKNFDDGEGSETSSISTASAKRYKNHEHTRHHPELEGVKLPDAPAAIPADVTLNRSRSMSRSKSRGRNPPAGSRSQIVEKKRGANRTRVVVNDTLAEHNASIEKKQHRKSVSTREARPASKSEEKPRRRSLSRPRKGDDNFNKSAPALANSAARSARRGDDAGESVAARSAATARNHLRDTRGSTPKFVSEKGSTPRRNRSQSRSKSRLAARSSSPPNTGLFRGAKSESVAKSSKRRSKSVCSKHACSANDLWKHHTADKSQGEKSRRTDITQPESLTSAEEIVRLNFDDRIEEEEEEDEQPRMIYKKRARRKNHQEEVVQAADGVGVEYAKPMALIALSSDEKSHASSISASSTIEESFADSDAEGGAEDENGEKRNVKGRALSALRGAGVRGKSAIRLGGLKGASKKWQSALFM